MQQRWNYTFGIGKLKKALLQGFTLADDGSLRLAMDEGHYAFLRRVDSFTQGFSWGRLCMEAWLPEECMLIVRGMALEQEEGVSEYLRDPDIPPSEKILIFKRQDGICSVGHRDILLYGLTGRYLFLCIQVAGSGKGRIGEIKLHNPGDNFMQTFPEIYQEQGSFFHRYLSVFSSVYNDIGEELQQLDRYLDFDEAPGELLPYFAHWLGLWQEGDFLEEEMFRRLLKNAYRLNRIKGTKQAVEELLELVLGEKVIIVERNLMEGYIASEDAKTLRKLYGASPQDVTVLVNRAPDEKLQAQLMQLIRLFKPARCRVRLVFYRNCSYLDSYCYLDYNARTEQKEQGRLDEKQQVGGNYVLV